MAALDLVGQILGIAGAGAAILSFQMKNNKHLYIAQGISGLLFAVNYLILGAYTSALINFINLFRGAFLASGEKFRKKRFLFLIEAMYLTSFIFTYSGVMSLLITLVQLTATVLFWTNNGKLIRLSQLVVSSPIWLVNNIMAGTIGGVITEVVNIISIFVSFIRYGFNGFEKAK
jgi:hypothetical protein